MFNFIKKFFDSNERQLKKMQPFVEQVNGLEKKVSAMSNEDMKKRISEIRNEIEILVEKVPKEAKSSIKVRDYKKDLPDYEISITSELKEYLPEVFAIVREITKRKYSRRHYDVQILAGIILAYGDNLVELKTGEGKTQVFHLPTALFALTGRGAHVITVNEYLARRDGEYAGHILSEIGLSVGVIIPRESYKFVPDTELKEVKGEDMYNERMDVDIKNPGDVRGWNLVKCSKKEAYDCDVVYGINNEFGFDYLRDNMVSRLENVVQRELYYCIIDEVDSILIDEARTPLIISAPAEESNELYLRFARIVPRLDSKEDYTIDEKSHSAVLTDRGIVKVEKMLNVKNLWEDYKLAHHLENALKAYTLYKKDDEYIIKDGKVLIVDQFTGRVLPGRRYSEGLHQAIEAKENVEIQKESKTLATITFQNFFRLYRILGGGSGTVITEAEEFYKIYNLDSYRVPTNKPLIRKDMTDRVYKNQEAKFNAVVEEIIQKNKKEQPVLVGTTSVEKSEYLSKLLDKNGVDHEVLNAKYHEREAHIVEKAGEKNAVTIATNMAGRGTDIRLGEGVTGFGGLHVIGTERHEARRIDNQLRGRSGRQGDPGSSRFYVSLDDEIMRLQGGQMIQSLMEKTNIPDDMPIESKLVGNAIERAQKRMEGYHFDMRNNVVKYDDVMNRQREIFYTKRRNILKNSDLISKEADKVNKEEIKEVKKDLMEKYKEDILGEVEVIINNHYVGEENVEVSNMIDDYLDLADDRAILSSFLSVSKKSKLLNINTKDIEKFEPKKQLKEALGGKERSEVSELLKHVTLGMIESKKKELGEDEFLKISGLLQLQVMDQLWSDHLDVMKDLREGIGLRGVAQRDPLVEYKNEGFEYFDDLIESISARFTRRIFKVHRIKERGPQTNIRTNVGQIQDILTGNREMTNAVRKYLQNKSQSPVKSKKGKKKKTIVKGHKIGRNDPCPCGSGKKYKKCCGKNI